MGHVWIISYYSYQVNMKYYTKNVTSYSTHLVGYNKSVYDSSQICTHRISTEMP